MATATERKDRGTEKEVHDLTKKEDVSHVIEQSIRSLHEMERRLVAMESELARMTGRPPAIGRPFGGPEHFTSPPFGGPVGMPMSPLQAAGGPFGAPISSLPFGAGSPMSPYAGFPPGFAPGPAPPHFAPPFFQPPLQNLHSPIQNLHSPLQNLQSPFQGPQSPMQNIQSSLQGLQSSLQGLGANAAQGQGQGIGNQIPLSGQGESLLGSFGGGLEGSMTRTRDLAELPPQVRQPQMDVLDQGKEYVVHVELPGVKKEDLDIMVTERALVLNAKMRPESDSGVVVHSERPPVLYRRNVILGSQCDTANAKANLKDGVLTVRVPKRSPSDGPRQLDVAYG